MNAIELKSAAQDIWEKFNAHDTSDTTSGSLRPT